MTDPSIDYAGQVADIPRTNMRISFIDRLIKVSEADQKPYLYVFSPKSIYLITLFPYSERSSLVANLPILDIPLITTRTKFAQQEIFRNSSSNSKMNEVEFEKEVRPAFQKLLIGNDAGKTPGDLLLYAENPNSERERLEKQLQFLLDGVKRYKRNQSDIDKILDAITLLDLGVLESEKSALSANAGEVLNNPSENKYEIYCPPAKHQKWVNEKNKNACYSISIVCSPQRKYPYRIKIENFYAPLGKTASGMEPILFNDAEGKHDAQIDLSEAEWLYVLDAIEKNINDTRALWYPEMREKDILAREKRKLLKQKQIS